MNYTKHLNTWEALNKNDFYAIKKLREEIFIVEQNCPYLDADNKDLDAFHLFYTHNNIPIAYCRLLPQGISYPDACSIGRVVVREAYRKEGMGRILMEEAIKQCGLLFTSNQIKISGQAYLTQFYQSLGFIIDSNPYLEDQIPHIQLRYPL